MEEDSSVPLENLEKIQFLKEKISTHFLDGNTELGVEAIQELLQLAEHDENSVEYWLLDLRRDVCEDLWNNKCYQAIVGIMTDNLERLEYRKHELEDPIPGNRQRYEVEMRFILACALAKSSSPGSLDEAIEQFKINRDFCEREKVVLDSDYPMIKCIVEFELSAVLRLKQIDDQEAELAWIKTSKDIIREKTRNHLSSEERQPFIKLKDALEYFDEGGLDSIQVMEWTNSTEADAPGISPFPPPAKVIFYMWSDKIRRSKSNREPDVQKNLGTTEVTDSECTAPLETREINGLVQPKGEGYQDPELESHVDTTTPLETRNINVPIELKGEGHQDSELKPRVDTKTQFVPDRSENQDNLPNTSFSALGALGAEAVTRDRDCDRDRSRSRFKPRHGRNRGRSLSHGEELLAGAAAIAAVGGGAEAVTRDRDRDRLRSRSKSRHGRNRGRSLSRGEQLLAGAAAIAAVGGAASDALSETPSSHRLGLLPEKFVDHTIENTPEVVHRDDDEGLVPQSQENEYDSRDLELKALAKNGVDSSVSANRTVTNDGQLLSAPLSEKALMADRWFKRLKTYTHPLINGREHKQQHTNGKQPTQPLNSGNLLSRQFKNCKINCKPYKRVVVAVIDTGVAMTPYQKPPLHIMENSNSFMKCGMAATGLGTWKRDDVGHGTAVASLVLRVCPNAEIMVLRVNYLVDEENNSNIDPNEAIKAIKHAQDHGADIISISLGWRRTSTEVEEALHEAAKTSLIFAATGNDGITGDTISTLFPARDSNVISVDRADGDGEDARGKNPPSNPDENATYRFTALGVEVLSSCPPSDPDTEDEKRFNGASFSTPIAAGVAALVLEFARQPPLGLCDKIQRQLKKRDCMRHVLKNLCSVQKDGFFFLSPWCKFRVEENAHQRNEKLDDDPYAAFSARSRVAELVLDKLQEKGHYFRDDMVAEIPTSLERFRKTGSQTW